MDSTETHDPSWVPDACSLPVTEQPLRLKEFDELLATAVIDSELLSDTLLRLTLTPTPEVAASAAELAARESQCCGFFSFILTVASLELSLDVAVPAARSEVLAALARRVGAARV